MSQIENLARHTVYLKSQPILTGEHPTTAIYLLVLLAVGWWDRVNATILKFEL